MNEKGNAEKNTNKRSDFNKKKDKLKDQRQSRVVLKRNSTVSQ